MTEPIENVRLSSSGINEEAPPEESKTLQAEDALILLFSTLHKKEPGQLQTKPQFFAQAVKKTQVVAPVNTVTNTNRKKRKWAKLKALGKAKVNPFTIKFIIEKHKIPPAKKKVRRVKKKTKKIHSTQILHTLKLQGYVHLAEKLSQTGQYPWNLILERKTPQVMEQLVDLFETLEQKESIWGEEITKKLFHYGLELGSSHLAKFIFLTNQLKEAPNDQKLCHKWIEKTFKHLLDVNFGQLGKTKEAHLKAPLQDSCLAGKCALPILLSNLLISGSGRFNVGIAEEVINHETLLKHVSVSILHQLKQTLNVFTNHPHIRDKLSELVIPKGSNAPANVVIRATLGIPTTQKITDVDAKKTAFSALLSHLRQGKDGSCFAIPLSIFLLTSRISQCLEDFHSLLKDSKLVRTVNHIQQDFPFLLKMPEKSLQLSFRLKRDGKMLGLGSDSAYIYKSPGINAACQALGLDSAKDASEKVLNDLFGSPELQSVITTPSEMLQKLVLHAKKLPLNQTVGLRELYLKACFSFEAKEAHPLLQVWQNAIAGMAEPDESGMVGSAVFAAIDSTFSLKLKQFLPKEADQMLLKTMLKEELDRTIHLQYDPMISGEKSLSDKRSTDGAFVLYDKSVGNTPASWQRIDNPEAFRDFLAKIIERIEMECSIKEDLKQYAQSDECLISCINAYYYRNKEINDPINQYKGMKYTPWVTKSGNNFSKVIQVYFEDFLASNSETFIPTQTTDLFLKIAKVAKNRSKEKTELILSSPQHSIPVRISGIHAFNLLLSHPALKLEDTELASWLSTEMKIPGKQISEMTMSTDAKHKFLQEIAKELLPKNVEQAFLKKMNTDTEHTTIKEIRNAVLNFVVDAPKKQRFSGSEIPNLVDLILIESLPIEVVDKVKNIAVHFADSNWADGVHDIHFCFLVNPGSGNLEVWAATDDNQKIFPLDQSHWVVEKKWEFFTEI